MRIFVCILAAFAFSAHAALTAPASEIIGQKVVDPARADLEEFTSAPFGDKLVLERAKELLLLEPGVDSTGLPDADEEYWLGIERWYERHDRPGLVHRQYVRARALLGRDVVDRTGEALGELRDFEVDLATGEVRRALLATNGDLRPVAVEKLLAPASGAALVLNIERQKEQP